MGVLELLVPDDWQVVRRNFERLERLFSLVSKDSDGFGFTVAGVSVRFGTATATWTASATSAAKTINHGLGHSPLAVLVSGATFQGSHIAAFDAYTYTTTQFTTHGQFVDGTSITGNSDFAWVAIG